MATAQKHRDRWIAVLAMSLWFAMTLGCQSQPQERSESAEWVTMDGYDASGGGVTVESINLWRNYMDRAAGVSGRAAHGEKVKLIRRSGDGVLVETASGQRGWVTYYFIREFK